MAMTAVALTATPCLAQVDPDLRLDQALDRADMLSESVLPDQTPSDEPPQPGLLSHSPGPLKPGESYLYTTFDLPFAYNSNPLGKPSGAEGDWQINPTVQLLAGHRFPDWLITAQLSANSLHYASTPDAEGDVASARFRVTFNPDAKTVVLQPYLQYTPSISFQDSFSDFDSWAQDFAAGVSASRKYGDTRTGLDMNGARRLSSKGDNTSWSTSITLKRLLKGDALTLVIKPSVRWRVYDQNSFGFIRKDTTVTLPVALDWQPRFLCRYHGAIVFAFSAVRNNSNLAIKEYNQWSFGPTIQLVKVMQDPHPNEFNCL